MRLVSTYKYICLCHTYVPSAVNNFYVTQARNTHDYVQFRTLSITKLLHTAAIYLIMKISKVPAREIALSFTSYHRIRHCQTELSRIIMQLRKCLPLVERIRRNRLIKSASRLCRFVTRLIAFRFALMSCHIDDIGLLGHERHSMISSFIGRPPKLFQEWRERANYFLYPFLGHAHVSRFR